MRNWLRYTALALAAAALVTVAAGCDIYLERRGAVTTPACALRNGYPSVAAVGGGALLCEWDYRAGESYLSRLDVRRDQVTLARTFSGEWSLVEQMFADGQVVLQRWEEAGSSFRFLNAKLEDVRDFVPEAEGGRLSHDGAGYYYLKNAALYRAYRELAQREHRVIFGGRLGEYRYYDMDGVVASALDLSVELIAQRN